MVPLLSAEYCANLIGSMPGQAAEATCTGLAWRERRRGTDGGTCKGHGGWVWGLVVHSMEQKQWYHGFQSIVYNFVEAPSGAVTLHGYHTEPLIRRGAHGAGILAP